MPPAVAIAESPFWEENEDKKILMELVVCFDKAGKEDDERGDKGDSGRLWTCLGLTCLRLRWSM
jgi:hypothetical protein